MGKEFELKYQASPEILEKIQNKLGDFTPIAMETTYFDTPRGDLKALRWTLRRRLENGTAICSLKTPGDGLHRGEWAWEGEDITAAVYVLCKLGAPEILRSYAEQGFLPVCGARLVRLARLTPVPGGTVELALDQGVFLGSGRQEPFSELEVELKSGTEEAAVAFAARLAAEYALQPEHRGKAERAMALMD